MMRTLLFAAVAAYLGYIYGKKEATIKAVVENKDRIEGAGEVLTGLQKVFG